MKKILLTLLFIFSLSAFSQESGYDKLSGNLDGVGGLERGWFTTFCNLDINYSSARFAWFLQNSKLGMTYTDEEAIDLKKFTFSYKLVPRVSSKNEYINVKYQTDKNYIIKKVEITGTPELILNIFLSYWRYKMNVEDNKTGEIANYNVMGDHISLTRLGSISKIEITPNDFNYAESFGIN